MGDGTWEWELRVAIPGGSRLRGILGTSGRWVRAVLSAQCHCYGHWAVVKYERVHTYWSLVAVGVGAWGCAVIADEAVLPCAVT